MKLIENQVFEEERALYGSSELTVKNCRFEGEADGESALKESSDIVADSCYFDLRYPFWHDTGVYIKDSVMTERCRAALWYSKHVDLEDSKLYGIKALRECSEVNIRCCDIKSAEFGWFTRSILARGATVEGEYFMMGSDFIDFEDVELHGKYSFQYISKATFDNCRFYTKDAFWHAKDITVKNSVIEGEYLAWYAENITFENCKIKGTQPFCYCKGLKLINCEMIDADLAFEKSDVEATLTAPVVSIKNPASGYIILPAVDEVIIDDENSKCVITKISPKSK